MVDSHLPAVPELVARGHGTGGDTGGHAGAQHFSVTACMLASIAAAAGLVSAMRANGSLASATLSSIE